MAHHPKEFSLGSVRGEGLFSLFLKEEFPLLFLGDVPVGSDHAEGETGVIPLHISHGPEVMD